MKITGTKKLLLSFFALACALGTGLGFGLSRSGATDITAYAASDKHVLPMAVGERASDAVSAADIEARDALAEATGIPADFISFYARSNNGTEKELYDSYVEDELTTFDGMKSFAEMYSEGELVPEEDISDEDWYVSPDQTAGYAPYWSCYLIGLGDSWSNYYSSKPGGITTEQQYYRNANFTMGYYVKWDQRKSATHHAMGKHNYMLYNIVWLEEGESYTFGFNSATGMNSVYCETTSSVNFLSTSTLLSNGSYSGYVRDYLFNSTKANEATVPNPKVNIDPDTSRNTYNDYLDEFGSTIAPASSDYTSSLGTGTGAKRMTIKPDAPSGAYMIVLQSSNNTQAGTQFIWWNRGGGSWRCNYNGYVADGTGNTVYSIYCTYATLVCRKGITKPKLEYNDGVSADLSSKTVNFNNEDHEMIIQGDWGSGLMDYQISEYVGGTWVPAAKNTSSTNVTQVSRGTRGSITKAGNLKFKAKNAGQYKIEITPFRNWKVESNEKDESDRTPVTFYFTIKPRELTIPTIMDDNVGTIDSATNTKSVFRTGKSLYISIYPAPTTWTTYDNPDGLSQFDWSTNGVLTLSHSEQHVYTVTINLKYNTPTQTNLSWSDGTTSPKTFKFDIGPMKVVVPDIIKDGGGGVTTFTKTVEYNGAYQILSFMPVDEDQLVINAINVTTGMGLSKTNTPLVPDTFCIKDNTLTLTALDAGRYEMTVSVSDEYVFDDPALSVELTYVLIINPKPIDAPILNEPTAVNNVKTVTYGGEKMADGTTDWIATLEFINADQSRIDWVSDTLNDAGWLDSTLKLAGRSAKIYDVTFTPKKNYRWKDGVTVPTYTLVIEKLKIGDPQLVKDGEAGATYDGPSASTPTSKTVRFNGDPHPFKIYFPTLASVKDIIYTKASSIEMQYNGTFDREWDGDYVTFKTSTAGEYTFEIFPTQNYCWSDGTTGSKIFNFIIQPIDIKSLEFWATNQWATGIQQYFYTSNGFNAIINYDGTPKTMRIGNDKPTTEAHKYQLTGDYAMYFGILDENGGFVDRTDEGLTGLAAKLPDGVTCTQENGYLTLTMTTAGVYRVAVMLQNTNFWWTETMSTQVVYTLTINPEGITAPEIDTAKCEGHDIHGHFSDTSMHGTYYNVDFALALKLDAKFTDEEYQDLIEVITPDNQTFVYIANRSDSLILQERDEALAEKNGTYTDWYNGVLYFYAKDQGEYNWTVKIISPNHAWAGKTEKEITFTITIDRSPVSGLEMHYVGDEEENKNILVQGATNVWGDAINALTVKYELAVYSEANKVIFFKRTSTDHLVDTGFSAQFSYVVNKFVMDSDYDVEDLTDVTELVFDDGELRLGVLDAGTYEIVITPTDNYCWNDNSKSISSIKFTLVINKLTIDTPLVILDDGSTTLTGVKEAEYDHKYLTMQLDLLTWPKGYAIKSFEYVSTDKADREAEGDLKPVKISGTGDLHGTDDVNLGVDVDTGLMSVQAQSAGEYLLTVVVSNVNNYQLAAGDKLLYRFNISRLSVSLPDAFLYKTHLTETEAKAIDKTDADVRVMAGSADASKFNSENSNTAEFDSYYHAVYLYGDSIKLGDFNITVETKTGNGDVKQEIIQPVDTVDGTSDATNYFRLAAFGVDTYTIVLKFNTRDFYWDKDISSSGQTRSYKFVITSKLISVPTVKGESNITLIDNRYTVEFPYVKDVATPNDSHRMITLTHVEFGVAIAGTTPTEYAIINSKVSTSSTANGVLLTNFPNQINGSYDPVYGEITMATSLDGIVGGEAKVTYTYVIELNIDPNNMRWDTGAEGDTLTKYYEIKIVKQKIARPYIIDTKNTTGNDKYVVYDGSDWVEELQIALMDPALISHTLSVTTMTDMLDTTDPDYANLLKVTAPAPAATYTVVAKIIDPDNAEWLDGSTDDITFNLIVNPIEVAKPYILIPTGSTEAQEGVVGWTKTVTYEDVGGVVEHFMNVNGFWQQDGSKFTDLPSGTQIPDVMTYTIENLAFKTEGYTKPAYVAGNDYVFNDGTLNFGAENAGKYVVRFKLSGNAVWLDGSKDDLDVTLIINKKTHTDLAIYLDRADANEWCDEVVGNTKTFTYKLDASGNPVDAFMKIVNFDDTLMTYDSLISGTMSATPGDGYLEESGTGLGLSADKTNYTVKAFNAGEYVIQFSLKDNANHRWEFADVATCTFKLQIKKLKLLQPVINSDYSLTNESIEGNTLTVDYDKNLHTILVESLFDNLNNGAYSVLGSKYFTVADNTAAKNLAGDPAYNAATHLTVFKSYDDTKTAGLKIKDLFEDTVTFDSTILNPAYSYNGVSANTDAELINLFRLTAYTPGDYYMTFTLTDSANMEWSGVTGNDIEFKIVINKVVHDAPVFAGSTLITQSKEYTGDKVEFTFNNVSNGKMTAVGAVITTASEEYEITGYTGPDATITANFATMNFEVSWFNGVLVLGFTEIGTYNVRISITDTDFIAWDGTTDTYKDFECIVAKRTVKSEVTFSAPGDSELDAKLREHKDVWPITVTGGVGAQIVLSGLRTTPTAASWNQRLGFKVYYEKITDVGVEIGSKTYEDTDTPVIWTPPVKQSDGTYSLTLWYAEIGNGKGNIKKGKYNLVIEQVDTDGNHKLDKVIVPFEVEGDPAPFKAEMLEWVYTRNIDPPSTAPASVNDQGAKPENRFILNYEEGVTYTFLPKLKSAYGGYDGSNPLFVTQLETYYVTWDKSYDGVQSPLNAGDNYVKIVIKLDVANSDTEDYKFDDYEFILYYNIKKAKYNLSNLEWYYDDTIATAPYTYTYDNADKSVSIVAKTGTTMPTGLVPSAYKTGGIYQTAATPNVDFPVATVNTNLMRYAGQYTTEVEFTVTSPNYERPIKGDPDTYDGSFEWTRDWTITPQHIVVDWVQGQTTSSDGTVTTRSKPSVAGTHAGKFSFIYEVEDSSQPTGWRAVSAITRSPGQTIMYRATASLKPGSGATDYARNYTFEFLGGDDPTIGNPLEFEVGGDDTIIYNHITVDGKIELDYEYTGSAFEADTEIDFDTSNGQITVAGNINILYYRRDLTTGDPVGSPIAAPYDIGNYIVILKLRYSGTTEDFALSEDRYEYNIIKAKLKAEDFEWRVKHNDGTNDIEAVYRDDLGGKWVNVDTKEEVTVEYDGKPYEVYLYSEFAASIIRFTYTDASQIYADTYTTTATDIMDTAHYEFDPSDPPSLTFTWEIKKHFLDLKNVKWNYEEAYVFTVVNGTPKAFFVEIDNLPDYLSSDKVKYTVYRGAEFVDGDITDYGTYTTTVEILEDKIDTDNYELGTWPAAVEKTITWEIKRRELVVPKDDRSWSEFDGVQHNLLKPFGFAVDWNEYFDVEVTYTDFEGNVTPNYDGTARFGGKYYAYDAGTYKFDLKIKQKFNGGTAADPRNNIVWVVTDDEGTRKTPDDQPVSYKVEKKQLIVTGWVENFELSRVVLFGNIDSAKFVDYDFYKGNSGSAGAEATLNDVLQSAGGDVFSMVPKIRGAYTGNIELSYETKDKFISFTTPEITEDNADKVVGKPYIYGYSINGSITYFTNDQIAAGDISVTYTGEDITFRIQNWDTYYSQYVTVYGGSLDDLTQREAGEYTLTLILRTDLEKPLYWGKTDDNKIDRSAVELKFKISYKMLTIPELPAEITYNGSVINILEKATNSTYSKLLAEYGNYVEISGNTAINVGEQTLYLNIKEEYGNAVRWNNNTDQGIVGAYTFAWKIIPVLIQKPEKDLDVRIEYDGYAHSVFEVLKGYDEKNPTPAIATLMANINEVNGRSINAGEFEAELSLPNNNYSWCDADGKALADRSPVIIPWKIGKKVIDFGDAYWGYMDGEEEVAYDENSPFTFTIVNGRVKNFTVEILGMPEILKTYTSYSTNGLPGNSAGAVSTYTTTVVFDLDRIDRKNFEVGVLPDDISQLVWKIVPREIDLPEYDESWTTFDGKVHDLTALLGLPEDWAEYLDISVEYKATEADSYDAYMGEDDYVVGYSNYNGFYFGFYKITVTLKTGSSILGNVKWVGGVAPEDIVIEVSELIINVTDWFEDDENSYVMLEDGATLPDEIAERLEYILYEDGDTNKTLLKPDDIVGGKKYYIEYVFKTGRDEKGVAYNYGIKLVFAKGVPNPLEFDTGNYGDQPIIWLPAPVLKTAVLEYNGEAQTFVINGMDSVYKLTYAKKNQLNAMYSLGLGDNVNSYIYLTNEKALTATSAGTYTAVIKLLGKVRLSWYDSTVYSVDSNGNLIYKSSGFTVPNAENLFNNKSFTVSYTITPKRVPLLTDEDLEKLMGIIVGYDGTEKDVTVEAKEVFDELEAKYGKIFDYAGKTGTAAAEYELTITLADLSSSYWYSEEPTKEVVSKVRLDGYEFKYVQDGSSWKLVLVKVDKYGTPELDSAGKYVEFNYGEYDVDVEYLPDFEYEFVKIKENDGDPEALWLTNPDGTINVANSYFLDEDGDQVTIDGKFVTYTYEMDKADNTVVVWYKKDDTLGFIPTTNPDEAEYVKRIVLDINADVKYGYKKYKTEDATEYTYLFNKLTIVDGVPVAIVDSEGKFIDTYLFFNGTDYELRKYDLDTDGKFISDGGTHYTFTPVEATCEMVNSDFYTISGGKFVVSVTGEYMLRYVLDGTNRKQQIVYAKDDNGNLIVDTEFTVVSEDVYVRITDKEYKVKWEISSAVLPMPEFDEEKMQQYTGGTLYAKDVLKGFLPDLMEIVEGGEGVDAGEYTAKIIITSPNSKWNPNDTTEDYVLVKWRIDTAKIDLSEVKWVFTDGTNTYDDCSEFVYTRVDGKPVVYWVELANLPEALKSKVTFTTNNKPGAYAGTDVGKYTTLVEYGTENDPNFEAFDIPEELKVIEWSIKRRFLDVPEIGSVWLVFDSEKHDLREVLGLPEDWNEYYTIKILYADNFVDYKDYKGYEGDPYTAFGSGAYKFTFTIKTGINPTVTNPNVVWKTTGTNPPVSGGPAESGPSESGPEASAPEGESLEAPTAASFVSVYSEEIEESTAIVEETEEVKLVKAEIKETAKQEVKVDGDVHVQEVCDRLKELAFGAEPQIKSFRKRGTV